jgi:hypothetical protein
MPATSLDELTKRNVKLSLGGSIHDPTDPVRLSHTAAPPVDLVEAAAERRTLQRLAGDGLA